MDAGDAGHADAGHACEGERAELTIEQLAAKVRMSVRNIRNHHSRGLLAPPEVRARVGYYNADHLARLRLILDLQAEGFNLTAIERLLSASGDSAAHLLGLRDAFAAPYENETPEVLTGEELVRRFGAVEPRDVERVRRLGLVAALGDDRYEVPSPALMRAAEEVIAVGVPLHAAIALVERVSRDCESIARAFVQLYLGAVGAVHRRRPARGALGRADRGDRHAARHRLGGAARGLQAAHDRAGRSASGKLIARQVKRSH